MTKVVSNKIARHFGLFYYIFRYYGVESFAAGFYPVLRSYIDSKFEGKDHPNIWKLITFDIISAFWRTSKYYQAAHPELYSECVGLMFKTYVNNSKPDIKQLYRDSMLECFRHRDPYRLDDFLAKLIGGYPAASFSKYEKVLEVFNNFILAFKWRMLPYLERLARQIVECDPALFKISATYSEEVPASLRLFVANNCDETNIVLISYTHVLFKVSPASDLCVFDTIVACCTKAVRELEDCPMMIFNSCVANMVQFFMYVYKARIFEYLSAEFVALGLELSYIARRRCANNTIINSTTMLVNCLFENLDLRPLIAQLQRDTVTAHIGDANWRIRENAMYIFQAANSFQFRPLDCSDFLVRTATEFCGDDNVYCMRRAKVCLKQVLEKQPACVAQLVASARQDAVSTRSALVLLAACATAQYRISDWAVGVCLSLLKMLPRVPLLKRTILDFFVDFKKIHLQLVLFQESRYDQETLENLKQLFNINSGHVMAF